VQDRAGDAARIVELEALAASLEQRLVETEGRMADHTLRILTAKLERQRFADAAADARAALETARAEIEAAHDAARAEVEIARAALSKAEEDRNAAVKALIDTSSVKADLQAECDRLNNHIRRQDQMLNAILASRSWRVMEPARRLVTFARRFRVRVVPGEIVQRIVQLFRRSIQRRPA
jgi:chromosome segregation ATPase